MTPPMDETRRIMVKIVADTRQFREQFARVQLLMEPHWWRRLRLRFIIWRIGRERD